MTTAAQRLTERHARRAEAGMLPSQLTAENLVSSMAHESDTWRWRLLVQAHGWIVRGVVSPEHFLSAPTTSLGLQWDTLVAELVGRALEESGVERPVWARPQPLIRQWSPFEVGRRTGWDNDLAALRILVDCNELVSL